MLGWIPWFQEDTKEDDTDKTGQTDHKEKEEDLSDSSKSIFDHLYWKRPLTLLEDLLTMGACLSRGSAPLINDPDGNEQDYHNRFIEDRVLGEGEFGTVTLVHDMKAADENNNALACKTLRKGVVFKDNTLYAPIKPEILQSEVNILRTLGGQHYCMALEGVYETSRMIYLVTEYCGGGEMMEYVSKQEEDLRTDDVSRIAFQMLDAVNHCAQHGIIHRDIKPENVMFRLPTPGSSLRLIDFGSGTDKQVEGMHTTFAGSAFYISPEMFQRTYLQKTDVWSVGVSLYVLVAGYPADVLQKAFNLLHKADRNLRDLPNFPDNMPDPFYDMLEGLLIYRHKKRKTAGEMLNHEFVQFHKEAFTVAHIVAEAQQEANKQALKDGLKTSMRKTQSVALLGSVGRHTLFLDYQRYERSLTTLLATLLDKNELNELVKALNQKLLVKKQEHEQKQKEAASGGDHIIEQQLDIIPIHDLKKILEEQQQEQVLTMITKLPGSGNYNTFAYSVELLKEFVRTDEDGGSRSMNPAHQRRSFRSGGSFRASFRGASLFARKDTSIRSVGSFRGRNRSFSSGKNKRSGVNTSIQEPGNLWKEWKAQSAAVFGTKNNTSQ